MRSGRISLAGAMGVLVLGLGPQAQAQFVRSGPRVTGRPTAPVAPAPAPAAPAATPPSDDTPAAPAAPASRGPPPVDGALPGGVLGLGDEGVGALIRPPDPAPGPLAAASTAGGVSDASAGSGDAGPAQAPRHAHRRRTPRAPKQPAPEAGGPE